MTVAHSKADQNATWDGPALSVVSLDDDPDFRQYLKSVLEGDGHEVRVCATPDEFFAEVESRLPDLVLLDIKMGRHNGEEVLEEIRRRWDKLCVIVVTGYPSMDSMRQTFKQDVFDYIAKDRLRVELGRQIRLARTERGWTLKDLSEASGVSVSQLSSIERGAHLPSLESMVSIAMAMDQKPSAWLEAAGL